MAASGLARQWETRLALIAACRIDRYAGRNQEGPMLTKVLAIALASSFIAAAPGAARADQPCRLMLATSLDMVPDADGNPTIPVSINGKDARMLIDTGGVYSMVTGTAASALGLRGEPIQPGVFYMTVYGQTLSRKATAETFAVGRLKLAHYGFLVMPGDMLDATLAGIVGPDILRRFDIELDFAGGKFNVFSQDHCEGKVVYWSDDYAVLPLEIDETGHITADATLDGKAVKVLIDTGGSRSFMTVGAARDLFGLETKDLTQLRPGTSGKDPIYGHVFQSLDLAGISVRNPNFLLRPDKSSAEREQIILGMSVLAKLHLYIAYGEKRLYVTAAGADKPK
ncbi:MAG TPA: retropepsin-like aspartic protease [Rhizomicrobium sp.]|jgi:predicted aspartyl protease|nr:retropepsin-like aspartic protease [Rhizomicrobium sp.]